MTNTELARQLEQKAVALEYATRKGDLAVLIPTDAKELAGLIREANTRLLQKVD